MIVFGRFHTLILTTFWIISFSQFYFVSGAKPRCIGEPLNPKDFSKEEDVGYIRDVCVDIIARNIYNKLKYPISSVCEELANMRTSTCFCKCFKWKRSGFLNKAATNRVMTLAEALLQNFLDDVSNDESLSDNDGEFIFQCINDAKRRLVDSGAAAEGSDIVDQMEDLKKLFCKRCALSENKDLLTAIKQFIGSFEAKNETKISTHHVEDSVAGKTSMSGIIRLKFEYRKDRDIQTNAVIIKIPSLAPLYHTHYKHMSLYDREAHFYEKLLPALYQLGQCEPFAPLLYIATQARVLVLEDLSVEGYKTQPAFTFLDLDHSLIALSMLAKYHALSYKYLQVLNRDDPSMFLIESSQPTIRSDTSREEFDALCEVVEPFLNGPLYWKMLKLENKIVVNLAVINYSDKNSMTVIIHGDFHSRNILFKHDSQGKIHQAKIIDWQMAKKASPIVDLMDFFVNNIDIEIFEANEDYLLNSYLATLNRNLSSVSTNRAYDRSELDSDMTFYKYHYFRILSFIGRDILNSKPPDMKSAAEKVVKWVIYLERKGFI